MSNPSDSIVGTTKKIVGEVLGDGKLVEEGERQKRGDDTQASEKDRGARRGGPFGLDK
jgi:uncharacterized protein YjbJ (UPF0337 family)